MITTKKLIGYWAVLAIVTVLGHTLETDLHKKAFDAAVKRVTAPIGVTDAEAVQWDYEFCKQHPEMTQELVKAGQSCDTIFADPTPEVARAAQKHYRSYHANSQDPHEEGSGVWDEVERLTTMFEVFYIVVSIAALLVFALWFKATLLPRLVAVKDLVKERTPSVGDLKDIGANRKVRQAESDFQTLKNLHENGLIDDEMFEKRKAVLKEALSANRAFQD
jgi:hypothetical protein